jgi:branched-chain amino acid transport system permease protein
MFEQQLINALSLGSVYALFALGFTLVFGVLGVINLAHGAIFMLGSYVALLLVNQFQMSLWLAMLIAMLTCGVIGVIVDFLVFDLCANGMPRIWHR